MYMMGTYQKSNGLTSQSAENEGDSQHSTTYQTLVITEPPESDEHLHVTVPLYCSAYLVTY